MPDTKLTYEVLPRYTDRAAVEALVEQGSWEELQQLPVALATSWPDWKYAQHICLRLADHVDPAVRGAACSGLAHIARIHRLLDKGLVKPVLLRELREQTIHRGRVVDAIEDINQFLGWRIGRRPSHND